MVVLLSGNLQEIIEGQGGLQAGMIGLGLGETFKEHSQVRFLFHFLFRLLRYMLFHTQRVT